MTHEEIYMLQIQAEQEVQMFATSLAFGMFALLIISGFIYASFFSVEARREKRRSARSIARRNTNSFLRRSR